MSDYVFYKPMAATAGKGGFQKKNDSKKDFFNSNFQVVTHREMSTLGSRPSWRPPPAGGKKTAMSDKKKLFSKQYIFHRTLATQEGNSLEMSIVLTR